jgi:protein tyrosine/serine phosphatase
MTSRSPLDILYNFHWVATGEAARSAQPYLGMWRIFLGGNGIKAIINLRGAHPKWHWWRAETRICREMGIVHFDTAINSRRLPPPARLGLLIDTFDAAPRPFLVKCSGGQDRTSFVSALYLLHRFGWAGWDAAVAQFARFPYLHFPHANQRWLRLFLDYAKLEANGAPVAAWLKSGYERERFVAWLDQNGHGKTFKGLYNPRH